MNESFRGKSAVILMATYNDWRSIPDLLVAIDRALAPLGISARVLVIDDGSVDTTGKELLPTLSLSVIDSVEEVVLASNQGNQRALAIGIAHVAAHMTCDYLVVMDSDHEDRPEAIPFLLQACRSRNDGVIVFAARTKRLEGFWFRALYSLYKSLYRILTGSPISIGNFSVIPGSFVNRLAHVAELWSHFPASIMRSRLPYDTIASERGARQFGTTSMNLVRLVVHAFSGFTVYADIAAARVMLFAVLVTGMILTVIVGLGIIRFATDIALLGWTSLIVAQFVVLMFQVLTAAAIMLMLVISMRMQPPMIPAHDYERFVFQVRQLYPAVAEAGVTEPLRPEVGAHSHR